MSLLASKNWLIGWKDTESIRRWKRKGLATIKLEFLNQEVSVGIKTRPSVKTESKHPGRNTTGKATTRKPSSSWEDQSGRN
ncbi:hypothetical protein Tco_1338027 [Tanacetum coccineum]